MNTLLAAVVALGMSGPGAPAASIEAPDPLLALSMEAPAMLCAACVCCSGMCTGIGGIENTPFGIVEPSYCTGCTISQACGGSMNRILGDRTFEEVIAQVWDRAEAGDWDTLTALAQTYDSFVSINADRMAVQIYGCQGNLMGHVPVLSADGK